MPRARKIKDKIIDQPIAEPIAETKSEPTVKSISRTTNKDVRIEDFAPLRSLPEPSKSGSKGFLYLALFLIIAATYLAIRTQPVNFMTQNEPAKTPEQLVEKVGKHIVLDKTQKPSVITIENIDLFKSEQSVFQDAQIGDKLIVYTSQAIVYREKDDVLIGVAPVLLEGITTTDKFFKAPKTVPPVNADATQGTSLIKVKIVNGGAPAGTAKSESERIKSLGNFEIESVGNAGRFYNEGQIINLTGKDISALEKLYSKLAVTSLPEGEASTSADVLIILGAK